MLDCTFITQNPQLSKWAHLLFFCRNRSCHSYQILWHHFYDDKNVTYNIKKLKSLHMSNWREFFTQCTSWTIRNVVLYYTVPPGFCDSAIAEFIAKSSKRCNFHNSRNIFAYFGLRRTPWRHRNTHSVWTFTVQWTAYVLLMPDLQELHRTNELKAERIRATRSRDTAIHSTGRYSEERSRIHHRINNISVKSWEMHSNSVKATDIRTNATDVETWKTLFIKHKSPPFTMNLT